MRRAADQLLFCSAGVKCHLCPVGASKGKFRHSDIFKLGFKRNNLAQLIIGIWPKKNKASVLLVASASETHSDLSVYLAVKAY